MSINEEECYWHVLEWVGDRHIQMVMDDADLRLHQRRNEDGSDEE